jgi:hypothetical protein
MTQRIHITKKDGGWTVNREGADRKQDYATQTEAVEAGRKALRDSGGGEIIVHGRDGRIRDKDTVFPRRKG